MPSKVQGKSDPKFAAVREEFERNFAERGEVGASVCLSVNGETLVDLWGGVADPETGDAWQENTISIVFSCSKAATALCAHILIDRGELKPGALVAEYWPEFARNGKEQTTVQMMLNHESALPALREPVKPGGFADWDYMIQRMADEEAFWEPGTRNGYHMINFGWTVGELVRRVSGKSLGTFFRDEVASKTGAKFWLGLPESEDVHIAPIRMYEPKPDDVPSEFTVKLMTDPESIQHKSFLNTGGWDFNDRKGQAAEIGGGGGLSNARGQVAMYTPLACNDGTLVSSDRLANMTMVSTATQKDATLLIPTRFASGFMKSMDNRALNLGPGTSAIIGDKAFGHVGAGGSIGFADPECGLAFSYTMNQMGGGLLLNDRCQSLIDAAYRAIGYRTNAPGAWIQ
ncbi:serine hydrolase domain-containing protein [Hyphomonas johnsonii]|jgi:CubicO group peptidase (beta-lactamase class C family)|uniref:Putative esterase n=1 Tax=Hyphomonas johnsonii MHS-2 TaxID=1280950 RepID=A0A059FAG0_9PROT|nr:serine hydrolase domain-containing protein [Hyphomonas johnsonii]KCZ87605.1 putative esterase [Hyphomonas johnsonii MHS-2]